MGGVQSVLNMLTANSVLHDYVLYFSRVIILIALFFFVLFLGMLGQHFLTRWMLKLTNRVFLRIPIFKSIFRVSREITKSFINQKSKPFKKTVLVDFPKSDSKAYAFLTNHAPEEVQQKVPHEQEMQSIFLPTAPHPISGYMMMIGKERLQEVDVSIEDVFKTLVSCGLYVPGEDKETSEKDDDDL